MPRADAGRGPSARTGFLVAVVATVAWYVVIGWGTDLTNAAFFNGLALGSGFLVVVGLVLAVPKRTRRLGAGLAVGAPVAFAVEYVVLLLLLISATS